LLAATFENIEAGIAVVDADLNLVAWNTRYEQLFSYPGELLYVGAPVADLIRTTRGAAISGGWISNIRSASGWPTCGAGRNTPLNATAPMGR
jgi:PAS domain-containing protein